MMTGQQLFYYYVEKGHCKNATPDQRDYAQTLKTAWLVIGATETFAKLEDAERAGKRIALTDPPMPPDACYEPDGIVLV